LRNDLNEESYYYVRGIDLDWNSFSIPFSEFDEITDWNRIKDVSFVLESWNVLKSKGVILIDEINFSS